MIRHVALVAIGVVLGFGSLAAGPVGMVLSGVATLAAYRASPPARRSQAAGLLLASASATAALLLGKLIWVDARDPAIMIAPGTWPLFVGAVILFAIGLIAAGNGAPRPKSRRSP